MMARSTTGSNQRPDTLMPDRIYRIDENLLQRTAGPYMWVIPAVVDPGRMFLRVRIAPKATVAAGN